MDSLHYTLIFSQMDSFERLGAYQDSTQQFALGTRAQTDSIFAWMSLCYMYNL